MPAPWWSPARPPRTRRRAHDPQRRRPCLTTRARARGASAPAAKGSSMETPACYAHLPKPVMPHVPPQKLLLGQKALVTGASSGIGKAIALSLGDAGADVIVNYVSGEDKAQALVEE